MLGHGSGDELRERLVKSLGVWLVLVRFGFDSSLESACERSVLVLLRFSSRAGVARDNGGDGAVRTSQV
jgi:hypothetical protein